MADSPLSDADSLSSAGASTEPLPGSDPAPISPMKRTSGPSRKNAGGGRGGNESDSSLTEQDSSDNEHDRDGSDEEEGVRGRKKRETSNDMEDEDMEPTPRARPSQKRRAIDDDEEEEEEGEGGSAGEGKRNVPDQFRAVMRAIDGDGGPRTDDEEEEVSDASDDEKDRDHVPGLGPPPAKRLRRGGASTNGSIISSSTANGRFSRAGSLANSLSDLEDETTESLAAVVTGESTSQEQDVQDENGQDAELVDGDQRSDDAESDTPIAKKSSKGRGKAGATKAKGARGGKKGTGARAGSTSQRPRSASPSARSDSPLSVVSSSDGTALLKAVKDSKRKTGEPSLSEETEGVVEYDSRNEDESSQNKQDGGSEYATGRSARGRGRGRARYRPPRGRGRGALSAPSISRSNSTESSNETLPKNDLPLFVDGNSSQAPELPEPSGLVELDTSEPARLADQLNELAETGDLPMEPIPTKEEIMQEREEKEEREERKQKEARGRETEEKEEKREPVKRVAPASAKKGGKKGGKKGKGKEKAIDQDAIAAEDEEAGAESDHEEDTSDAAFMRKRGEAMEHLTKIEIQFAKLRDMLYVERLTEVEKDRIAIEAGAHPELIHLTQLLELRRNKRLELAKAWLDGLESSYDRQYFSDEHAMWNHWQNKRAELRSEMLDDANSKRRRLDREKRNLERPKDDTLASILAPRPPPAVPLHHRRRLGFDGEALVENEIAWALRNPDVRADPSLSSLEDADAYADLERMGLREPIGHPGMYSYDHLYGPAPPHLSGFSDPRTAHLAPGYPYSAYDHAAIAMQSHAFTAAAAPASFGSLPPLPGRDQPPSRPPSNPRHGNYPGDVNGSQHGYGAGAASNRIYPYSTFPETMSGEGVQQHQHGSWPGKPSHVYGIEEERRRTMSAGGNLGSTESLDSIAGSRQNGGGANGHDDAMNGIRPVENGGRTTPVGGSNPKPRLTLDDHMSHRSPKSTTSAAKATERSGSGRSSPSSFMAIPTIPPFDRHRHEMAIAAARANSPHPPSIHQHSKPSQATLYPQSPASAPSEHAQYPQHAGIPGHPAAAQRAGYL